MTGGGQEIKVSADSVFAKEGEKEYLSLQGTVYKKVHTSDYQILYLKNNSIIYYDQIYYESRILIYDDSFKEIEVGNLIYASGKGKPFEAAHNPGNFDSKIHYARQGIYGRVWCENVQKLSDDVNVLAEGLFRFKKAWSDRIMHHVGEAQGGILNAILTGDKNEMEDSKQTLYQKNGISHILAISGLHISFLGLGIYQLLRKIGCSFGKSGIIAGTILILYVWMIGTPVSALRALLMLLFRMGADVCGRVFDMATALLLSACVMVTCQPLYLMDAGFLLSYGAIGGILIVCPALEFLLPKWCMRIPGFTVSISVQVMLFPILLYFYFETSTYSVLLNLIVIPLTSVLLSLGMFASLLCIVWESAGGLLFSGCRLILLFFENINSIGVRLPFSTITFGRPSFGWIVGYYICLLLVVFLIGLCRKESKVYRKYFCLLLTGFCLVAYTKYDTKGKLRVTFLDVGQGDCIFLRGPNDGTYLVDGGSSDVSNVGQYRMIPYLKSQGIEELDYVFVTHGDADHYSGIAELLSEDNLDVRIDTLVLPAVYQQQEALCELKEKAQEQGVGVACIEPGMLLTEEKLSITCIQPEADMDGKESNAMSLVLDVKFGDMDLLLTGDVEAQGEEVLAENLRFAQGYEVLKVAHHGSKNSSMGELLEKIKPGIAIISAGRDNSYGHPHAETIERLQKWTKQIYSTAVSGAITLESDGKSISVKGFH